MNSLLVKQGEHLQLQFDGMMRSNVNATQASLKARKDGLSESLKEIVLYIDMYKNILLSKHFSQ